MTSRLVKIERIRHAADEPFALETCYLPANEFSGVVDAPLARTSLFAILEHDYHVGIAYADEEVDATIAEGRSLAPNSPGHLLVQKQACHLWHRLL
jgi:DNA-binding GntR family transcriptional regulator